MTDIRSIKYNPISLGDYMDYIETCKELDKKEGEKHNTKTSSSGLGEDTSHKESRTKTKTKGMEER